VLCRYVQYLHTCSTKDSLQRWDSRNLDSAARPLSERSAQAGEMSHLDLSLFLLFELKLRAAFVLDQALCIIPGPVKSCTVHTAVLLLAAVAEVAGRTRRLLRETAGHRRTQR
jgi:hypothetical protein